ncbi:MAG: DAK2 domain-containing protein, partial [Clostridia bacterium]|nr:DAK2 domain-containing protein [Clostridia bacterium]
TILTVMRSWANQLSRSEGSDVPIPIQLRRALRAARKAEKETTNQMELLKQYGVVDAGAKAFVSILEGVDQYVLNPELPLGTEKVKSNGYTGYATETWRVVYENGKEVSRTFENKSTYKMYDKIIEHNPKPVEPTTPVVSTTEPTTESTELADPTVPTESQPETTQATGE